MIQQSSNHLMKLTMSSVQNKHIGIRFASRTLLSAVILVLLLLGGCSLPRGEQISLGIEKAQIIFSITPLRPLAEQDSVELVIRDEVTGLPFNEEHITLERQGSGQLQVSYLAPVGTVITYRYEKLTSNGARIPEVTVTGEQVRLRRYHVAQPAELIESIAGWEDDLPDPGVVGSITGKVVTEELGFPVKDILVTAGGVQTITDADGYFSLFPLSAGLHNLIAVSMDGQFLPSQYSVQVGTGQVTPADIQLTNTGWKQVTFNLSVPEDTIEGAPIRLAGNLLSLGNTFIELGGGMSGDTKQMPQLTRTSQGNFSLTLTLPAGIDIRYKYTMGDGFWNSDHGMDNKFVTHQLIIPAGSDDLVIEDQVYTWKTSETETIWFRATVPNTTPLEESISVQFLLGTWMPSLPMFKINADTWAFPLISPHNFSGELPYRYCRNTPCTGVIQAGIEQLESPRLTLTQFSETHLIKDTISGWTFLPEVTNQGSQIPESPQKASGFISGLALTPYYTPTNLPYISSLVNTNDSVYNHILLSPAWVAQSPFSPVLFAPSAEKTVRWQNISAEIETAHNHGFSVSLFPQVIFPGNSLDWWTAFPGDNQVYWQRWLDQYRNMVYQYADLAEEANAEFLVIGGSWLTPALPVGSNAESYHLPGNIESLWKETISGIRDRYHGQVAWQLDADVAQDPPAFLSNVDALYLQWDIPAEPYTDISDLAAQIGAELDTIAEALATNPGKPVTLILAYPSISGYNQSCIPSPNDEGNCINIEALLLGPSVENPALTDLVSQADYYLAFLTAVNQRTWVKGVLSQGYYPVNQIQDTSASIHGKPAEFIFAKWTTQVLGK